MSYPVGIYLFKAAISIAEHQNNVRNMFKVKKEDIITTLISRSGVFIINLEQALYIVLVFLLLILNK